MMSGDCLLTAFVSFRTAVMIIFRWDGNTSFAWRFTLLNSTDDFVFHTIAVL